MKSRTVKLVIGTAQFGMAYGIANKKGQVSEDEVFEILSMSEKNGIDTLDTAKIYGHSESVIGKYLELHPNSSWNIITKIDNNNKNVSIQVEDSYEKMGIYPPSALNLLIKTRVFNIYLGGNYQMEWIWQMEN